MHASQRPQAERRLQLPFSKSNIFNGLLVAGLAMGTHLLLLDLPDRSASPDTTAEVLVDQVVLKPQSLTPLRIAGAWQLTSREQRFGGISALALDHGNLVGITDSGVTIRLPKPTGQRVMARFHDLPSGPGSPRHKAGRDSEALAWDAGGRGWWVGFEILHSAWLFDRDFDRVERIVDLRPLKWRSNLGIEGALSAGDDLWLFPERGNEMIRVSARGQERIALDNEFGRIADVTRLRDGRVVVLSRNYSPLGFSAQLLLLDGNRLRPLSTLTLGRLDNPEAIAAEALPNGSTRLWLMTDNDNRRRVPTLLIALDWPA